MKTRFKGALVILAAFTALTLAACGGGQVRGGGASVDDETFRYAYRLDVISTGWDPALAYSNEIIVMHNIYETLTRYDPETKTVEPRLATEWSSSDDGREWEFTLQPGATFHSGNPVTAQSVKSSIERTIEVEGSAAYIWDGLQRIDTPDEQTVVFVMEEPAALDMISSAAFGAFIYDVDASGGEDLHDWFEEGQDAGSGPYTVAEYNKGQEIEVALKAYDDYWGGWGEDQFSRVEFRVTPEETTGWQLLQRGDVDYVQQLNAQLIAQAEATDGVTPVSTESFQNLLLLLNTASGPLEDVRVRQAVQKALDVDAITSALQGAGTTASGFIPEGLIGFSPDLTLRQDTAGAKRLLEEAGVGDGLTLRATYAEGDFLQQTVATLMNSQLADVGITLDVQPMSWNAQVDQARSADVDGRQDIFMFYWYPDFADPYSWLINIFHSSDEPFFNLTYLDDPELDERIQSAGRQLAVDPDEAGREIVSLQESIINDSAAVVPVFVQNQLRGVRSDVAGFVDNPLYLDVPFVYDMTRSS